MNPAIHRYQLCFRSLYHRGRGFAFPCDPQGHVDLAYLSAAGRDNYRRARTLVGRELSQPEVQRCRELH